MDVHLWHNTVPPVIVALLKNDGKLCVDIITSQALNGKPSQVIFLIFGRKIHPFSCPKLDGFSIRWLWTEGKSQKLNNGNGWKFHPKCYICQILAMRSVVRSLLSDELMMIKFKIYESTTFNLTYKPHFKYNKNQQMSKIFKSLSSILHVFFAIFSHFEQTLDIYKSS